MTSKRDWLFRADYLTMHAESLERRADGLKDEARRIRIRADTAQTIANGMPDEPPIVVGAQLFRESVGR